MNVDYKEMKIVPAEVAGVYVWFCKNLNIYYVGMTNNLLRRHREFVTGQYSNQVFELLPANYTTYDYAYTVVYTAYKTQDETPELRKALHEKEVEVIKQMSKKYDVFNMQDISGENIQWFQTHLEELRKRAKEYKDQQRALYEKNRAKMLKKNINCFWWVYKSSGKLVRLALDYLKELSVEERRDVCTAISAYKFRSEKLNDFIAKNKREKQ